MKFKGLFSTAIAISAGLIVLLGFFLDIPLLVSLRVAFLQWAVILAAAALLVGVGNLVAVHFKKVRQRDARSIYSLILLVFLLVTLILGLAFGPQHPTMQSLFSAIQLPIEASLMALLAVTLLFASIRLLRRRANLMTVIFLITVLIILLGTAPLPFGSIPILSDLVRPYIAQVPAAAGARGILLGVALGTLTTGLRILFGADRPYGSK